MPKSIFEKEIEDFLKLKSKSTQTVYIPSFNEFLRYYRKKHGKGKNISHYLDRIFDELKKDPREQGRVAELEIVEYLDWLKKISPCTK